MGYLQLNQIGCYTRSLKLADMVWSIVITWGSFEKMTVGQQMVRSFDSISANIAEGFGRYSKADKIHFYRYSQGSVKESCDWLIKCRNRKLLTIKVYDQLIFELQEMPREINQLINYTREKLAK
jgi:four helix bundle protein